MVRGPTAASRLIARQRAAAEALRREVLGSDGSLRHPYFRGLQRQLRDYSRVASFDEIVEACCSADLVYVGDFHAAPAFQLFLERLLGRLARRPDRALDLGVEFVYTRQQRLLDRRQAAELDDATFRRSIHYEEEWGYAWERFGGILDRARELDVPVFALDAPPRGGYQGLVRRDRHAARRIVALRRARPERRLIVFFGESHLAEAHLPRQVERALARKGVSTRRVCVFQDPDELYWKLLHRGESIPEAVEVSSDCWAVFHGNPMTKYEGYRQVLERWQGDVPHDEDVDLTPAVHHLIDVLVGWLDIRSGRVKVRYQGGSTEDLADVLPEVYSGQDGSELLPSILAEHGRRAVEVTEARRVLEQRGAWYDSRSNSIFLARYQPGRAAAEGARFLRAAMSGRLFRPATERWEDPVARTYGAAYNEALALLGSHLVDPASDYLHEGERRALMAAAGGAPDPEGAGERARSRWLEQHRSFEKSGGYRLPEELRNPLTRSRADRRILVRELAYRLGWMLYERVRNGALSARGLRLLFRRRLTAVRAHRVVLGLLRDPSGS